MDERINIHSLSPNYHNHLDYSTKNVGISKSYSNTQQEELLKQQNDNIKALKRSIKGYQKNSEAQNAKLSTQDTLFIELNSLNKNYAQLENELNQCKAETFRLNDTIQTKNTIITEFQKLIELSTTKFKIFEETNSALRLKIEEYEAKLHLLPNLISDNNSLKDKISGYEAKIEAITNENSKREELFKSKLSHCEKKNKATIGQHEDDMQELRIAIERLKIENEKYKKMAQEANLTLIDKESTFKGKMEDKEKEYDKLSKRLMKLQQELKEIELNYKDKMNLSKDANDKLDKELRQLSSELKAKIVEIQRLNSVIFNYSTTLTELDQELKSRGNLISNLTEDKERSMKQLNDKQLDFVEYQNSSQQEIDILHRKNISMDKERANAIKENEANKKELFRLKEQIALYESHSRTHLKECQSVDGKYNDLVRALELKDEEHEAEYETFSSLIIKNQNEGSVLKAKYEKKIQMLKLTNEELETRVKSLINSLIALKDYAISIERNMNENSNIAMNNSAFLNNNNLNLSNVNYSNSNEYNYNSNNKNSRQLINGLKEIIGKIDSKILSSQGNNATYQFDNRICYEN